VSTFDAFVLRLLERGGNAFLVFASGRDRIDAERDPILDDFVLLCRIGIRRPVEKQFDASNSCPRRARFFAVNKVIDAFALRQNAM
jgi:hypothetical protein